MPTADRTSGTAKRVCIVTPGYISSTPRVVREADALSAAGYNVRVVFTQGQLDEVREFDDRVVSGRPWRTSVFRWSNRRPEERWAYRFSGIRQRALQALSPGILDLPGVTERAEGRVFPELARLAASEAADLVIGHYPVGLAAAHWAARRHRARLGYDIEDLYPDTFPDGPEWRKPRARILTIERRYVAGCAHLSAVSRPVADAFAQRYDTPLPVVVHNCHAWQDRASIDGARRERTGSGLSLFWFSQTIGLDRGLQDAIRAVARLEAPAEIHLRGSADAGVERTLRQLAESCGVGSRLHFHPPCPPQELLSRAAEHDVGLALETDDSLNRQLTVTNKLFLYLTAGLAIAATDLPGQRSVFDVSPDIGVLYACGDAEALAVHLARWARDPEQLRATQRAALDAARARWNAEAEGERVVAAVTECLEQPQRQTRASGG